MIYKILSSTLCAAITLTTVSPVVAQPMPTEPLISAPKISNKEKEQARPVGTADGGVITGVVFDIIGYVFIVVGGLTASELIPVDLGVSISLMSAGGGFLTLGSLIGTISYQIKHDAYEDAGYDVRSGPMAGAWTLTALSVGSYAGAIGLAVQAAAEDSTGLSLASFGLAVGAGLFEIFNWLITRKNWQNAIDQSPRRGAIADSTPINLFPTLSTRFDATVGAQRTDIGLGITF